MNAIDTAAGAAVTQDVAAAVAAAMRRRTATHKTFYDLQESVQAAVAEGQALTTEAGRAAQAPASVSEVRDLLARWPAVVRSLKDARAALVETEDAITHGRDLVAALERQKRLATVLRFVLVGAVLYFIVFA